MSWNIKYQLLLFNHLDVSLFVRLWVEIIASPKENVALPVSLFVRLWVEISGQFQIFSNWLVSLFVRLWVEIINVLDKIKKEICQPLREAVSWNLLNIPISCLETSQPLREAVSWNENAMRLWVEILCPYTSCPTVSVSLFVRLWVEILMQLLSSCLPQSASSWGCELKCVSCLRRTICTRQPLREAVSWNVFIIILVRPVTVSLFVRLWVEITVEKFSMSDIRCQPLREAVSWNIKGVFSGNWRQVSLFVRLWVEIWHATPYTLRQDRQPLREAVSWNTNNLTAINSK